MNTHENHDRRRGMALVLLETDCTVFICLDCREQGLTKQDISDWAELSAEDYKRHAEWLDAEWFNITGGTA